jgi:hypothetical protein
VCAAGKIDFDQWFSPSAPYIQDATMTMDRVVTGTTSSFQFNSAAFYPLNGQLLGASNPSADNRYFTMEVRGSCAQQQLCRDIQAVQCSKCQVRLR